MDPLKLMGTCETVFSTWLRFLGACACKTSGALGVIYHNATRLRFATTPTQLLQVLLNHNRFYRYGRCKKRTCIHTYPYTPSHVVLVMPPSPRSNPSPSCACPHSMFISCPSCLQSCLRVWFKLLAHVESDKFCCLCHCDR